MLHVLSLQQKFNRVLLRTDSAAVVYAFDTGAAHDTDFLPLLTLTLAIYARVQMKRFDFRALHIRGIDNIIADILSRLGNNLFTFDPPYALLGAVSV